MCALAARSLSSSLNWLWWAPASEHGIPTLGAGIHDPRRVDKVPDDRRGRAVRRVSRGAMTHLESGVVSADHVALSCDLCFRAVTYACSPGWRRRHRPRRTTTAAAASCRGLVERPLGGAEEDREDYERDLVDEIVLDERPHQLGAAVHDESHHPLCRPSSCTIPRCPSRSMNSSCSDWIESSKAVIRTADPLRGRAVLPGVMIDADPFSGRPRRPRQGAIASLFGSIRIFACFSGSRSASNAAGTPASPTDPVSIGDGSTLPSAMR
jgi:hypothetical protein